MDYLGYLAVGAVCYWLGWRMRGAVFLYNLSENPEKVMETLKQIQKLNDAEEAGFDAEDAVKIAKGVKVRAEIVGGVFYLYSLDDDQFVAQGPTVEDAFKVAQTRFPGKSFWLEKNDISNQTA